MRTLPRLYPIVDAGTLQHRGIDLLSFVNGLLEGGAGILQLRNKQGSPSEVLAQAAQISTLLDAGSCLPVMNDRADLAVLVGWRAVHVGHRDLPPEAVRKVLGADALVGVSTHNREQVLAADRGCADYVAIGPVYPTGSKTDTEPVIGVAGVRQARLATTKPLVAIGGITRQNAAEVIAAGADSVAVIGGLLEEGVPTARLVQDFLDCLR